MKTKRTLGPTNDVIMSPEEVSKYLGFSRRTVYKYLETGIIPARKIGNRWFVMESALLKLISGEEL